MDGSSSDVLEFDLAEEAGALDFDVRSEEGLHIDGDEEMAKNEGHSDSCSLVGSSEHDTAGLVQSDEDLLLMSSDGESELEIELEDEGNLLEQEVLLGRPCHRGGLSPTARPFRWAPLLLRALLCTLTMPLLLDSFLLSCLTLSTNFSGIGTPEHAKHFLEAASVVAFGHKVSMHCASACDSNRRNQAILSNMGTGACVFDNILSASQLGADMFQDAAKAGTVDFEAAWEKLRHFGVDLRHRRCAAHGSTCSVPRASIEVAGTPCQPWSSMGAGLGQRSPLIIMFIVWCLVMREVQPFVIIHENVVGFDMQLLIKCLGDLYTITWLKVSPRDVGFAFIHRVRLYAVLYLRKGVRMLASPQDVYSAVVDSLRVEAACPPNEYCIASADALLAAENKARRRRKLQPVGVKTACWKYLLTEKQRGYLHTFSTKWQAARGSAPEQSPSCIFNLGQNPDHRAMQTSSSDSIPTATSGCGLYWSPCLKRWLLPVELAAMHGFPVSESLAAEAGVPVDPCRDMYSFPQIGNSMHLANVGSVMAVALACAGPAAGQ